MTHLAYFGRERSGARDDALYVGLRMQMRILRAMAGPRQCRSVGVALFVALMPTLGG
jgi:hypothetical protein